MIGAYLQQTAMLRRPTGLAADGSRTYTSTSILCRFEPRTRLITNQKGEQVTSSARLFTVEEVRIGDLIVHNGREWPVISASEQWTLDAVSHYEVYL